MLEIMLEIMLKKCLKKVLETQIREGPESEKTTLFSEEHSVVPVYWFGSPDEGRKSVFRGRQTTFRKAGIVSGTKKGGRNCYKRG